MSNNKSDVTSRRIQAEKRRRLYIVKAPKKGGLIYPVEQPLVRMSVNIRRRALF